MNNKIIWLTLNILALMLALIWLFQRDMPVEFSLREYWWYGLCFFSAVIAPSIVPVIPYFLVSILLLVIFKPDTNNIHFIEVLIWISPFISAVLILVAKKFQKGWPWNSFD